MKIYSQPRFADMDAAYRAIIEVHRGLADEQSAALNAALVLILANHIGDQEVLVDTLALARAAISLPAGQAGN